MMEMEQILTLGPEVAKKKAQCAAQVKVPVVRVMIRRVPQKPQFVQNMDTASAQHISQEVQSVVLV